MRGDGLSDKERARDREHASGSSSLQLLLRFGSDEVIYADDGPWVGRSRWPISGTARWVAGAERGRV
ncbi:hypothetical protein [Streptomyces sp. NPDC007083]|uniref:hypothetical protein n=1 Tax=unclassified Streptomyces TaxID=2593676 RepID=UPI003402438C